MLNYLAWDRKEQKKGNEMILQEVKHSYVSSSFTFSQDSAMCFSGLSQLIALKFTAFKARAQLITWLTKTPPVNYSSCEIWTFCWPTDDTAHYTHLAQKKTPTVQCCALISYIDLPFSFIFCFFPSVVVTLPLPLLLFPSLWWCKVSLSPCTRSVTNAQWVMLWLIFCNKDSIKVIRWLCNWIFFTGKLVTLLYKRKCSGILSSRFCINPLTLLCRHCALIMKKENMYQVSRNTLVLILTLISRSILIKIILIKINIQFT